MSLLTHVTSAPWLRCYLTLLTLLHPFHYKNREHTQSSTPKCDKAIAADPPLTLSCLHRLLHMHEPSHVTASLRSLPEGDSAITGDLHPVKVGDDVIGLKHLGYRGCGAELANQDALDL